MKNILKTLLKPIFNKLNSIVPYFVLIISLNSCSNELNEIKALTKPVLTTPENNTFVTDELSQKLDWDNSSSVGLSGPIYYQVFFGESQASMNLVSSTRDSFFKTDNLEYDKIYYWKVVSVSDGKSETSEVYNFKIRETTTIEKEALLSIYEDLNGENWTNKTNWNSDSDISTWFGVEVNTKGQVIGLDLSNNNLIGDFPDNIANLRNLKKLNLSGNIFKTENNEFPIKLTELTKLEVLLLNNCNLDSNLDAESQEIFLTPKIGNLAALKKLNLSDNNLSGPLVIKWGNLKNLEELVISDNNFNAILSKELGNLRALKKIIADNNQFSGSIPAEIANIQSLEEFLFQNNQLEGQLPDFSKSNMKIFFVDLNAALEGNLLDAGLCGLSSDKINIDNTLIENNCP